MGLAGAVVLGSFVFFINYDHGFWPGLTAASKQAFYTFFAGGLLTRLCENLSVRYEKKLPALLMAMSVPTILSLVLTYAVHSLRGTPEPLMSLIPTAIMSPPSFLWWGYVSRRRASGKVKGDR